MTAANRPATVPNTPESAFRELIRVYGLVKRVQEPYFARFGITGSQWGVMRTLQRAEKEGLPGLRLTDLSDRLLIRPPSVTGVIDRMQRQGLVARSASETDLRSKYVSLTAAGRELVERVLESHAARHRELLGGLNPKDVLRLRELLNQLGTHLETVVAEQDGAAAP
jgi:DNA-binding MarR family transcriptional regulator